MGGSRGSRRSSSRGSPLTPISVDSTPLGLMLSLVMATSSRLLLLVTLGALWSLVIAGFAMSFEMVVGAGWIGAHGSRQSLRGDDAATRGWPRDVVPPWPSPSGLSVVSIPAYRQISAWREDAAGDHDPFSMTHVEYGWPCAIWSSTSFWCRDLSQAQQPLWSPAWETGQEFHWRGLALCTAAWAPILMACDVLARLWRRRAHGAGPSHAPEIARYPRFTRYPRLTRRRAAVTAILGLLTSVAVAGAAVGFNRLGGLSWDWVRGVRWGQRAFVDREGGSEAARRGWPVAVDPTWPKPDSWMLQELPGIRSFQCTREPTDPDPRGIDLLHTEYGWPTTVFSESSLSSRGDPSKWPSSEVVEIPLHAHWRGVALGALAWTAILLACDWLVCLLLGARRNARIQRGVCPSCGHPMANSTICHECGAQIAAQEAKTNGTSATKLA